jgi:hypothetical protein
MDISEATIVQNFILKIHNFIKKSFPRIVVGANNPRIPLKMTSCKHSCHGYDYIFNPVCCSINEVAVNVTYNEKNKSICISLGGYNGDEDRKYWYAIPTIEIALNDGKFFETLSEALDEKLSKFIKKQRELMALLDKQLRTWEVSIMRNRETKEQIL